MSAAVRDEERLGQALGGGAVALAARVRLHDAGVELPSRAVLLSPTVDASGTSPSWTSNVAIDWVAQAQGAGALSE